MSPGKKSEHETTYWSEKEIPNENGELSHEYYNIRVTAPRFYGKEFIELLKDYSFSSSSSSSNNSSNSSESRNSSKASETASNSSSSSIFTRSISSSPV